MSELARLLLFVAIAGSAVTFMGSLAIWYGDEDRRIRRALRHVLKADPEGLILARGRGRGAGFSFSTNLLAVAWDRGAWCLIYRLDELMGAELLVDGQVLGRVFRGEGRRAIDHVSPQAETVTLRLIFDDPRHPDFALELWVPGDAQRRESRSPAELVQEANRWLARCEAIVRRPLPPRAVKETVVAAPVRAADPEPFEDEVRAPTPLPEGPPPIPRRSSFDDVPRAAAPPPRPAARPGAQAAPAVAAAAPVEPDMFDDPPWDDDRDDEADDMVMAPPEPEPSYKPVSKARRETAADQDELPFDD